jgi:hypothetical protein
MYLAEVSPDKIRGKISLLFGLALTIGELFALVFGVPFGYGVSDEYWMLMFACPTVFRLL